MVNTHQPVLLEETISLLGCQPGGVYVDGTIGEGGHAFHIFKSCPDIRLLIGIDLDEEALVQAQKRLEPFKNRCLLIKGNYSQIKTIISKLDLLPISFFLLREDLVFNQMVL